MALFIEIQVDPAVAREAEIAKRLVECCPVDIFAQDADGALRIVDENLDECTLCELCLAAAPAGKLRVCKLYDEGRALERSA